MVVARSEPRFRDRNLEPPHLDPEVVETVSRLHQLPEGTLGWCLADFYATHGFAVPGSEITPNTYLYFAHDNIHVISGIAPTGAGEIALGGFQMCMDDNQASTFAFFSPLVLHETGISAIDEIVAKGSTLARPYAAELLGSEMARRVAHDGRLRLDRPPRARAASPRGGAGARTASSRPQIADDGHHIYW